MTLLKEFMYKGVKVQFYESTRYLQLIGGGGMVKNFHAFIDGQDVSHAVLTFDGIDEWEKMAKQLIDQYIP